jgi:hypothetical protein
MHHKRVVQEKEKLVNDIKRLRRYVSHTHIIDTIIHHILNIHTYDAYIHLILIHSHMRSYEPAIEEIKRRHGVAMKEKMLIRLERDRIKTRVKSLEEQLAGMYHNNRHDYTEYTH